MGFKFDKNNSFEYLFFDAWNGCSEEYLSNFNNLIMQVTANKTVNDSSWQKVIMKYNKADIRKSVWQLVNSIVPYIGLWFLMIYSLQVSYLLTIFLAVIAAGLLVRVFIIFHYCGHGSFFHTKKVNDLVGIICGILVFTPYHMWHKQHASHHATTVNLDKRGVGDIWTMTVNEYLSSSKGKRFIYRTFRNPFILFTFGPLFLFFIKNRFAKKDLTSNEKWNVYFTNLVLLAIATGMSLLIGLKAYLLIQLPIIYLGHLIGLWLFYIQHQFEDVAWEDSSTWDYKTAAISGSSFLKLPLILQWFTGNIGFHHIHHLSPRIPNYNLERCQNENDLFSDVKPITFFTTFKAMRLSLWDETSRQLVRFRKVRVNT